MTGKHTPGPWTAYEFCGDHFVGFASDDSGPALRVGSWHSAREANANLIAAAPDMLAALKMVVTDETWGIDHPTYLKCRAAIRKAEGRE